VSRGRIRKDVAAANSTIQSVDSALTSISELRSSLGSVPQNVLSVLQG